MNNNIIKARLGLEFPILYEDMLNFYSAMDSIYSDSINIKHKSDKKNHQLFIYGIEKGSIILELAPKNNVLFEEANIQAEFIKELESTIYAIQEENYNKLPNWVSSSTIANVKKLLSPLKDTIHGDITISVGEQKKVELLIEPLQAKDTINKIPQAKQYLASDSNLPKLYRQTEFIWEKTLHNKENHDTIIAKEISKNGQDVEFKHLDEKLYCKHYNNQHTTDWQDMVYIADINVHYTKKDEIIKFEIIKLYPDSCYKKQNNQKEDSNNDSSS